MDASKLHLKKLVKDALTDKDCETICNEREATAWSAFSKPRVMLTLHDTTACDSSFFAIKVQVLQKIKSTEKQLPYVHANVTVVRDSKIREYYKLFARCPCQKLWQRRI